MKVRSKVTACSLAVALTAAVAGTQAALTKAANAAVIAKAPPTYLLGAQGSSVDGFWSDEDAEEECDYCDNPTYCGCFIADGSNGGNGLFQFNGGANTPMNWTVELDYDDGSNDLPTAITGDECVAASGFGSVTQQVGKYANVFNYETTGLLCDTVSGNDTYSGSYVLEGGQRAYSGATGSGNLNIGVLDNEDGPDDYVNQIQFTGNLGR